MSSRVRRGRHAERQQPLLRRVRELAERLTHALAQLLHAPVRRDRPSRYGPEAVGLPVLAVTWFARRHGPKRTGRGGKTAVFRFHGLRNNLRLRRYGGVVPIELAAGQRPFAV